MLLLQRSLEARWGLTCALLGTVYLRRCPRRFSLMSIVRPTPKFENLHLMNSICSSASDFGAYSAHRSQAEVGAKPVLCGGGVAQTNKLLDIRHRRDDCGK